MLPTRRVLGSEPGEGEGGVGTTPSQFERKSKAFLARKPSEFSRHDEKEEEKEKRLQLGSGGGGDDALEREECARFSEGRRRCHMLTYRISYRNVSYRMNRINYRSC